MKKRIVAILLLATVSLSNVPMGMFAPMTVHGAEVGQGDSITDKNAPMISGASKVQIKKGTAFNEKDVLYRVMAMDREDGDLTHKIQKVSGSVNTNAIGNYTLTYKVTDSDGKVANFSTVVEVIENNTNTRTFQKTLFTRPGAEKIELGGTSRGYHHDRQWLGFLLKSGQEVSVKIVNAKEFGNKLTLHLFTDDQNTQKEYTLPADGSTIKLDTKKNGNPIKNADGSLASMVPVIKTVQSNVKPIIEFTLGNEVIDLPYYHYKDNEANFFSKWDSSGADYAIIEGTGATMLIHKRDRNIIVEPNTKDSYKFKSLDELMEFYDDVVKTFDEFIGLEFNAVDPVDENGRGRFFIKPNKNGAGAAYYSGDHTAQNGNSISGYLRRDWLPIHEFGHGYEGSIGSKDIAITDVFNNVLCHFYERKYLKPGDNGWSSLQKLDLVEEKFADLREQGARYNDYDYDGKLYLFVNLLNRIGPKESTSTLYHDWRTLESKGKTNNISAMDVMAESYSNSSGYNLVPYLEEAGLDISEITKAKIYEKNYPILYFLRDSFIADDEAKAIEKRLGANGMYGLVSVEDLKVTGKKGNLNAKLNIDDLEQIKGKVIKLKDGDQVIAQEVVESENVMFGNVPIGTYSIEVPATKTGLYGTDYIHVSVKADTTTTKTIDYTNANKNLFANGTQIRLGGIYSNYLMNVSLDYTTMKAKITTDKSQPHYYFNEKYAAIEVIGANNVKKYSKEMIGTQNYEKTSKEIAFELGDKIKVYHREPNGRHNLYSSNTGNFIKNFQPTTEEREITYVITKYGLMRENWDENKRVSVYKSQLEEAVELLKKVSTTEDLNNKNAYNMLKMTIASGMSILSQQDQNTFKEKYPFIFKGSAPKAIVGEHLHKAVGEYFVLSDLISIKDEEDGSLLAKDFKYDIPVAGDGKYSTPGTYTITYSATDTDGNKVNGSVTLYVEQSNKNELFNNISIASKKEEGNYTSNTFATLSSALAEARNVYSDTSASQSGVDGANTKLKIAIAGLQKLDKILEIQNKDMKVTAGSEETASSNDRGSNVLDGNPATIWHSKWSGNDRANQYLIIDMLKNQQVKGIKAQPRGAKDDGSAANGTITKYKIEVSTDGVSYQQVAQGTWAADAKEKTVNFDNFKTARYIRLVSLESVGGFSSLAELKILGKSDFTELTELLGDSNIQQFGYTKESYDVYKEKRAVLEGIIERGEASIDEIEKATIEYKTAIKKLVQVGDKTKLVETINTYQGKTKGDYTQETFAIYENTLALARQVNNNVNASQREIDDIVAKLQHAVDGLISQITEFTELPTRDMVATSPSYQSSFEPNKVLDDDNESHWHSNYSDKAREKQYITIQLGGLYEISKVSQTPRQPNINGFIKKYRLEYSIDGQNYKTAKEGAWETTAGVKTIELAQPIKARYIRLYSLESVGDFTSIISLRVVGKHANDLANKEELKNAISLGDSKNPSEYTTDSYKKFKVKLDEAKAILGRKEATQEVVDTATQGLNNAISALVKDNSRPVVDKTQLRTLIDILSSMEASGYTPESYTSLQAALSNARAIIESQSASAEQVQDAVNRLNAAKEDLKPLILPSLNGWKQEGNKWYFYNTKGEKSTGWLVDLGTWYLLDNAGAMLTGWQASGNAWYLLDGSGAMLTGWQQVGNQWYYLNGSGVMLAGWQQIGGQWYYLNASGTMLTGWQQIGGQWYYLGASGVMVTGWQQIGGEWYLLLGSGTMVTGWYQSGNTWYYMNASGVMATGWQQINEDWYYMDASGVMTTGWKLINQTWYYFKNNGVMLTGSHVIDGDPYYFGPSGNLIS